MSAPILFQGLLISWFGLAVITLTALFFIVAPYGRHARKGWGPALNDRLSWLIMELPAPLAFAGCFLVGSNRDTLLAWVFLLLWEAHYIHRTFIYPFGRRGPRKRIPISIAGIAFIFNIGNGYINGQYLFTYSGGYPNTWLMDPRFIIGLIFFFTGYVINRHADRTLRYLRKPGESGYAIPCGGMYRWVSCPNYLGEIIEWVGWAIATWSLAGLAFATWVVANLTPRARDHHRWYREQFANYPPARKALLPGIW